MSLPLIQRDPPPLVSWASELLAMGSLSSPIFGGPPRQAAGALLRALGSLVGDLGAAFEQDVHRQCEVVAEHAPGWTLTAQLLQKVPTDPGAGYARSAERFHLDLAPRELAGGLRLIRLYFGAGTRWIPRDNEPASLRQLRESPRDTLSLPRYQEEMASLERHPPLFEQVPPGHTLLYGGGLEDGLVHRAPPCVEPRLLLVVTATSVPPGRSP